MERIRSILRSSFRSGKRDKRGKPIVATDSELTDGEHEVSHRVTLSSSDKQATADAVRNGTCAYPVKYYGSVSVSESRGIALCTDAMKEVRRRYRKRKKTERETSRSLTLRISADSIRIENEQTQTLIANEPVDKVSFCMADRSRRRVFCFVARDAASESWLLHTLKTESRHGAAVVGEQVCHAIGSAFEYFSEKSKAQPDGALTDDAFAISAAGVPKLSPIAEEDTGANLALFRPRQSAPVPAAAFKRDPETPRHVSETESEGHADEETETSALLLRGTEVRATVPSVQPPQPPKRPPPPFTRNAAERRTVQGDSGAAAGNSSSKGGFLRFSLRLPDMIKSRSKDGDQSRKSVLKNAFKRPRAARLLSGSESAEDEPAAVADDSHTQQPVVPTTSVSKNGNAETAATRVPRVTSKKHEPTYGRLDEPQKDVAKKSSDSGDRTRRALSSSSSVEAEQSENEIDQDREPVRKLISKFERNSLNERVPLRPNDDPFANAPLSKSSVRAKSTLA